MSAPMRSMPQLNGPKAEVWESPPSLGIGTKLGLLGHLFTFIGLHTRLWIWSLGTAWEGVRHPISPSLWANLHYVLLGHI